MKYLTLTGSDDLKEEIVIRIVPPSKADSSNDKLINESRAFSYILSGLLPVKMLWNCEMLRDEMWSMTRPNIKEYIEKLMGYEAAFNSFVVSAIETESL